MNITEMYNYLIGNGIATEEEIALVTAINGDNEETYCDILFVRTGWRNFDFLNEKEGKEYEN